MEGEEVLTAESHDRYNTTRLASNGYALTILVDRDDMKVEVRVDEAYDVVKVSYVYEQFMEEIVEVCNHINEWSEIPRSIHTLRVWNIHS